MLSLQQVLTGVWWVSLPSAPELASLFCRFQEFYESPMWRAKVFTTEQFLAWHKTSGLRPYEEWDGFNVPGWVFRVFAHGLMDPLSPDEQKLVELTQGLHDPFYVVGALEGDLATLRHEMAHGLFYLQPSYRQAVQQVLADAGGLSAFGPLVEYLKRNDYADSRLEDEAHAYLAWNEDWLQEEGLDTSPWAETADKLRAVFRETSGQLRQR